MSAVIVDAVDDLRDRLSRLPQVTALLAAGAEAHDRDATFPYDGVRAVHDAGLLTLTVGRRYGGPAASAVDVLNTLRELGRGDPSVALVTAMTLFTHLQQDIAPDWPEEVYAQVLAESALGPVLINALRVEPELGTPARGGIPATTARWTPAGWRLTGRKIYSTGSVGLAWMVVWAATDEAVPRVGGFLVRGDSAGITIEETWDHLGLRASASHDVVLDEVLVPHHHHQTLTPAGSPAAPNPLGARLFGLVGLLTPALYVGVAEAALEWLVGFVNSRIPTSLGAPLATLPRFQAAVGEIAVRIGGAEQLLLSAARGIDEGDPDAIAHAGGLKVLATRELIGAVEAAVALVGNPGLARSNPLQRHYRDVLCSRVHTPQDDAVLLGVGRNLLTTKGSPHAR